MEWGAGMASGQKGGLEGWRPEAIPERVDGVDGVGEVSVSNYLKFALSIISLNLKTAKRLDMLVCARVRVSARVRLLYCFVDGTFGHSDLEIGLRYYCTAFSISA